MDFHHALAVEDFQCARGGNVDGVVEIETQHLALGRHDADHAKARCADLQGGAERVGAAEQFGAHFCAQYRVGAWVARIIGGQELADCHLHVEGTGKVRAFAVYRYAPAAPLGADFRVAHHAGIGVLRVARGLQRQRIVHRQQPRAADGADRGTARAGFAGRCGDDVGAELGELGQHKTMDAVADRGEQNHRGDAHRDARGGQEGAQPVRGQRVQGKAEGVGETHFPLSALTGSSLAARAAGSRLARMPVTRAVETPATLAHSGGQAGSCG